MKFEDIRRLASEAGRDMALLLAKIPEADDQISDEDFFNISARALTNLVTFLDRTTGFTYLQHMIDDLKRQKADEDKMAEKLIPKFKDELKRRGKKGMTQDEVDAWWCEQRMKAA